MVEQILEFSEKVMYRLRNLYAGYGYRQYKMSKFEEYDFYVRNKDFLISDSIITFTDTNGKLMALKPDVTLSIVKNSSQDLQGVQKLYYNENVYRVAKGSGAFREIPQAGLECLGNVDAYCISEVLLLAAMSLREISQDSVLILSHMGLLTDAMEELEIPQQIQSAVLGYICEKNMHEMAALCLKAGVPEENVAILKQLAVTSGAPEQVLDKVRSLLNGKCSSALAQLSQVLEALKGSEILSMLRVDFSMVNDIRFYNGFVFQGFIQGIPESVLSGGQYDKLMEKRSPNAGAVGFAIYMDLLERIHRDNDRFDVDVLLIYESETPLWQIHQAVAALSEAGERILVQPCVPKNIRYKKLAKLNGSEVKILENNA